MIEDFFHLPPMSTAPLVHIELRIYPRIFENIRNDPHGILRARGKLIHTKNRKSRDTVPFIEELYHMLRPSTSFRVR
jgi:hypothetical protein